MISFAPHHEDDIRLKNITPGVAIQQLQIDRDLLVLLQRRPWWKLVVRCVSLPFNRRERVLQEGFEQVLEDALAIAAVGHDDDATLLLVETSRVVSPAIVMALFEEHFPVRRPVKSPGQSVAQADCLVLISDLFVQRWELMF